MRSPLTPRQALICAVVFMFSAVCAVVLARWFRKGNL